MAGPSGLYRNPNAYDNDLEAQSSYSPTRSLGPGSGSAPRHAQGQFNIATDFFDLPIILEAGPQAAYCYLAALLWTARHGTNGVIPAGAIASLADWRAMEADPGEVIDRCVQVGLFDKRQRSYHVKDYTMMR